MERRSILQALVAFFVSFFGRFTRIGRKPELAACTRPPVPTGPRGVVSPKAEWFSPSTYEVVPSISEGTQHRMREAWEIRAPVNPPDALGPQEGYEVMRLKNPAIKRVVMGYAKAPPARHVNPTGPVAKANTDVWQPLETFQPLIGHPELEASGTVLGTFHRPATAPRLNVGNDDDFRVATDKKLGETSWASKLPPELAPTPEEQDRLAQIRAKLDANYAELEANWGDDMPFDPADVERALNEARPLMIERHLAFKGIKS